eukprot:CAMPEP_0119304050 /NCGR_PEP_ID=MMETSP1333-20130426/5378_1 /TAXON_ID=418940 /ORGANISM="Scyphosphaera apsteinii, Strain RCC1455" /LENGTH=71 /DNA_ID=CAMNT_0007306861 /DNA_START=173 /DNA_END=388 /DNA_ORIENTATION=+
MRALLTAVLAAAGAAIRREASSTDISEWGGDGMEEDTCEDRREDLWTAAIEGPTGGGTPWTGTAAAVLGVG